MTAIEHGSDCRPEDMSEPDEEGISDCHCCGLWEKTEPASGHFNPTSDEEENER